MLRNRFRDLQLREMR